MKLETKAVHVGHEIDPATGALVTPIHLTTTFERQPDGEYPFGYTYTRDNNPNRAGLEMVMAELEGGVAAAAFASGSTAMMTVLQALSPQDHVLAPDDIYYGIRVILTEFLGQWGLETTFVDMTDLDAVKAALRPNTKLVMIETPSNPRIKITDIQALANVAHEAGAYLICDVTFAPILQLPLALGADFVMHSTTKYLGGHHDAAGGIIVTREENPLFDRIRHLQQKGGAILAPFTSWLVRRGIQTLPLRIRAHSESALKVALFLDEHPAVERVLYPGLASHPGHEIAARQMSAFGGMMSVLVRGGQEDAMAVTGRVGLFIRATSFGGTHSLIEHRASMEAEGTRTPLNLLRISIGLENTDDLIEDLDQALTR